MAIDVTVGSTEDERGRQIHPILGNTTKDGSGTWYVPLVDANGKLLLGAGTSLLGATMGVLKEVRTTKAIDASIGAYTANDVVNDDDCCTTAAPWTFTAVARANGASGYIVGATIVSESESVTPRLTLLLFNTTPAVNGATELTDNSANNSPDHADLAKYIGKIDFPALESLGTTDSNATITPSTVGNLPLAFKCATADDDLYGILVTRDAFTQTATDDMTIILQIEQY